MPHTEGIDNVVIYWDDDDGENYASQLLTGRIEVHVVKTTSFRGVRLKLSGTMRIKWIELDAGSTIPFEEFENIIYENLDIFSPNPRDKDARWIFPGLHVYKFQYQLPRDIPYSLDGSRYGRIEYKSKAEVLIPTCNPVESLEEEFIIHSRDTPEVEARQEAMEAMLPKENVEYGVLGGGCFVKKSHVELYLKLDKSVYKQGQVIRPVVECTVEKGKCDVDAVMVVLVQEMIYTCNLEEVDESRKKEVLVMAEDRNEEDADPGEKEIYNDFKLKIDRNLPPTGFPHCDFIECGYFIHAVAKTNRLYDDIVVKLPIIIQHGDTEDWEQVEEDKLVEEKTADDVEDVVVDENVSSIAIVDDETNEVVDDDVDEEATVVTESAENEKVEEIKAEEEAEIIEADDDKKSLLDDGDDMD